MKFRATFSSVGVQWLERFVPVFDKLGKELSVLLTPNTLHLVQDAVASGGLELHADLLKDEVFDEYKIASNNADKIAFALEPATLHRVLRGLIGSEATHVEVKLIKRTVAPGKALPFLNFSSKGVVDITQDVPLAGPLTKREVARLETLVQANVKDVPYWLNLDRSATESTAVTVERLKAVGAVVELATTRAGALHLVAVSAGAGGAVHRRRAPEPHLAPRGEGATGTRTDRRPVGRRVHRRGGAAAEGENLGGGGGGARGHEASVEEPRGDARQSERLSGRGGGEQGARRAGVPVRQAGRARERRRGADGARPGGRGG